MSKKKNRNSQQFESKPVSNTGGPPWILIGGVLAVIGVTSFVMLSRSPSGNSSENTDSTLAANQGSSAEEPEVPERPAPPPTPADRTPVPSADAQMPPLPPVSNMVPRAPEVVRDAYIFAAQRPDILEYVPCFCGCETAGHTRNADCFVASRNEDGAVREWDTHGMACTICVDVARDAMQLSASGASTVDIRAAVESKYAAYPRQTSTPSPPAN
ncbi:MAG: PCYCGC motif-containing (lipo)protein [Vicinamibacterales bacterium]